LTYLGKDLIADLNLCSTREDDKEHLIARLLDRHRFTRPDPKQIKIAPVRRQSTGRDNGLIVIRLGAKVKRHKGEISRRPG
jgi:hypothetical protein